jgi:prepilin-type N-terminal cleavage/methylation domain-containing protein/prepilin-type processing-associated H-X9-DG protein
MDENSHPAATHVGGEVMPGCRRGLSLLELLVAVAILAVLVGLTAAAVQRVRGSAAKAACQNHLRQIGLGLTNHHATHGRFPVGHTDRDEPGSFALRGWMVPLLPFVDQPAVWEQAVHAAKTHPEKFSDSPPHPFDTPIAVYGCPADGRVRDKVFAREKRWVALTSYLGVAGTRNVRRDGVLFTGGSVRVTDITDGASNTLAVGERPPSPDMWVGWYAGYGVDFAGTADTILGVRERATPDYERILDCGPGSTSFRPGRFDAMCDVMHFWSPHPGGANFLFADGAVRFLPYSAADVMPALATRAGGEGAAPPE